MGTGIVSVAVSLDGVETISRLAAPEILAGEGAGDTRRRGRGTERASR
jgi:hypothetical protein